MNNRLLERFGAWCGVLYLAVFGTGWLLVARFFPRSRPAPGRRRSPLSSRIGICR